MCLLGYTKNKLKKNLHLISFYEQCAFYLFLAMSRLRNKNNALCWGQVLCAAEHYHGNVTKSNQQDSMYFGLSSSFDSLLGHLSKAREDYPSICKILLWQDKVTMMIFDNGQKGIPYQLQ